MLFDLTPKERREDLFDREEELSLLLEVVRAGRWAAVLGPRMVGKTSLVKAALSELRSEGFRTVYVSLWGARSGQKLLEALSRAVRESLGTVDRIRSALSSLEEVSLGPGGVSLRVGGRATRGLADLLAAIGSTGEPTVVAMDEVQEVAAMSRRLLEVLGNVHNTYPNVRFVFTGSVFGLIRTLLEPGPSSPLYGRPPARVVLRPFSRGASLRFLREGFAELGVRVSEAELEEAVSALDGYPGWLTLYGNARGVEGLPHGEALERTFEEAAKVVRLELEHFLRWKRSRELYLAALRAAAIPSTWTEISQRMEVAVGRPVNPKTVDSVLDSLQEAYMLERRGDLYAVRDPVLRRLLSSSGSIG